MSFWARTDSNSANNPSLNLTGAPAVAIDFAAQPGGDTILEQNGGLPDPDTFVVINGVEYEFTFELTGTLPTTKNNGSQQVPDHLEGEPVIVVTVIDYPAPGETTRLAFLENGTATQADMDAFGNGAIDIQNATTTPPDTPVCFVRGTMIETAKGPVAIEDLQVGDEIKTLDNGFKPIRWIGSSIMPAMGNAAPVRIRAGTMGNTNDLLVSPQHRMMLTGWRLELMFGETEVLVSAKSLVNDKTICRKTGGMVEYFHMLFDNHEIIFAEGIPCESLHTGDQALSSLGEESRNEILAIFPELADGGGALRPKVRMFLKSFEGKLAFEAGLEST